MPGHHHVGWGMGLNAAILLQSHDSGKQIYFFVHDQIQNYPRSSTGEYLKEPISHPFMPCNNLQDSRWLKAMRKVWKVPCVSEMNRWHQIMCWRGVHFQVLLVINLQVVLKNVFWPNMRICSECLKWILDRHSSNSLQWHHNECDDVSNHQHCECLLNPLFRPRSKKTVKLHITGLCEGNPPVTGGFPSQRASNAENVFIWWHHHVMTNSILQFLGVNWVL